MGREDPRITGDGAQRHRYHPHMAPAEVSVATACEECHSRVEDRQSKRRLGNAREEHDSRVSLTGQSPLDARRRRFLRSNLSSPTPFTVATPSHGSSVYVRTSEL